MDLGSVLVWIGLLLIVGGFVATKVSQAQAANTAESVSLKQFVRANRSVASYQGVHVYPDRIIRLQTFAESESHPVAGVSATIEETGGISARSTLTRSTVPGLHGWQKQTDNRRGYIVIDGPDFQWQVQYAPQFDMGGARKFVAAANTMSRKAAMVDPP